MVLGISQLAGRGCLQVASGLAFVLVLAANARTAGGWGEWSLTAKSTWRRVGGVFFSMWNLGLSCKITKIKGTCQKIPTENSNTSVCRPWRSTLSTEKSIKFAENPKNHQPGPGGFQQCSPGHSDGRWRWPGNFYATSSPDTFFERILKDLKF